MRGALKDGEDGEDGEDGAGIAIYYTVDEAVIELS
jgi:hypothetical protein